MTTRFFAAALAFLSASLLFGVQPHWGRRLAPTVGGGPAVWNACLVFFQTALLAGYAYAHLLQFRFARRAAAVHAFVLAAAAVWLFVVAPWTSDAPAASPTLHTVWTLAESIGLPVAVLSASAPLLHQWGLTPDARERSGYGVYAASNAGSLVALLVYPVLIEPRLGLDAQWAAWRCGFVTFAGLIIAFAVSRRGQVPARVAPSESPPTITVGSRLAWLFWAALPSSLLVSVTQRMTEDVAAGPMLWLPPLAAFLLASILAFAGRSPPVAMLAWILVPLLLLRGFVLAAANLAPTLWIQVAVELAVFFIATWCSFAILYAKRPIDADAAPFYLWLALGGAIGGGCASLLAPYVFRSTVEHPLCLLLICLLLPPTGRATRRSASEILVLAGIVMMIALGLHDGSEAASLEWLLLIGGVGMLLAMAVQRPLAIGLATATPLALAVQFGASSDRSIVTTVRSEFGVHRVVEFRDADGAIYHALRHGGVVHGWQCREPGRTWTPLGYYHPSSAVGEALAWRKEAATSGEVAVVGLGAGAALVHRRDDQRYVFFEIDPAVGRIAADSRLFTYLDSAASHVNVRIGDGRLLLNSTPDGAFSTIFLDAFSGDAVPTHLLTKEAFALYSQKLKPNGAIVVNATNWFVDLESVVANVGSSVGLAVVGKSQSAERNEVRPGPAPTRCLVLMKNEGLLEPLASRSDWRRLPPSPETSTWTDDFCDLWSVVRWKGR